MKAKRVSFCTRKGVWRLRNLAVAGVSVFVVLLTVMTYVSVVSSLEIPPEVEKKAVSLKKSHADAERFFTAECGKCHKIPDPAKSETLKPGCMSVLHKDQLDKMQDYMANVRAGKSLYESYCGRCHTLIDPGSHTLDYWSKNLCTSDSCMVKRRLNSDEEQQVLLFLSSHSKKD